MKWNEPKLVDLADRSNALNAVGFSTCNCTGDQHMQTCVPGGQESYVPSVCYSGGYASIKK